MFRTILLAAIAVATVCATGEFIVLHSPDSVEFNGKQEIDQSLLKEVFSAALGFTPKKRGNWSGMYISNPFDLPEAVVGIAIEGVESLDSPRGKKFPLEVDEVEETTWQALSRRLEERDNDNTLVRICVSDGLDALGQSALGELKPTSFDESSLKSLSITNEEGHNYIEEIKLLHAIAKKVRSAITANGKPDVYWLVVSGVRPLIDLYGKDSAAVKEALALLNDALSDISKAFMDAYSDKVVIAAFTNDASKVRNTRAINLARERREDTKNPKDDSNVNDNIPESTSPSPVSETPKSDDGDDGEKSEKNEEEESKTKGSSLTKTDENPSNPENDKAESENTDTEAPETRETSTEKSSQELDGAIRNNDHTNTDTEHTNRPLKAEELNLAKKYNDSYPVIFNILLWFGVAFFFSLLAICITIADMDPGRDSIIYRMTSNRMKKDN